MTTALVPRSLDQLVARCITNAIICGIMIACCPVDQRKTLFTGRGRILHPIYQWTRRS